MMDKKQRAIEEIKKHRKKIAELYVEFTTTIDAIRAYAADLERPELDESCTECPMYDKGKSCCPRYSRLIPEALAAARKGRPKSFKIFDTQTRKISDTDYLEYLAGYEEWAFKLCMFDMEQFAMGEDGTLYLLDECGRWEYAPEGRFEIRWEMSDEAGTGETK